MPVLTTTLAKLCRQRVQPRLYNQLGRILRGEPFTKRDAGFPRYMPTFFEQTVEIPLELILDTFGTDDALWALRASNCSERDARLFSVAVVRQVQCLMPDAVVAALDVADRFANGLATAQELAAVRRVVKGFCSNLAIARAAIYVTDRDAIYAAYGASVGAAEAAGHEACRAACAYAAHDACDTTYAARQRQTELFRQLCQGTAPWQTQP